MSDRELLDKANALSKAALAEQVVVLLQAERSAYWRGYYDACRNLDRSVRMSKPQREVIHGQAALARKHLEELGVAFDA